VGQLASLFTGEAPVGAPREGPAPRAPYRILLVDDEVNVLRALQRAFRQENYEIVSAANGEEALELIRTQPFHLVISDYMMPGMNGGELLKQAKTLRPDMQRIMLTGHADVNAVVAAVKGGAVYKFILKPWNDEDLRVTVALALEQYDLIERNRRLQRDNDTRGKELSQLSQLAFNNRSRLAIMLHKRNHLTMQQMQELCRLQQSRREPLIKILLEKAWVPEGLIHDLLKKDLMMQEAALAEMAVDPAVAALIPGSVCDRQWVLPLRQEGRRLVVAMADPLDVGLIDDLRFMSGLEIEPVIAPVSAIREKIKEIHGIAGDAAVQRLETFFTGSDPYEGIEIVIDEDVEQISIEELLQGTEEPPAIRLVNAVILEAIRLRASDIHIQPQTKNVVVRYRIDGVLSDKIHIPQQLHQSLVSRLKVMSELDISERRRPQDGRVTVRTPLRMVDLRISTLPTINGEKVVMRILDRNGAVQSLNQLGLLPADLEKVKLIVQKPQGIVLATGPTGSGKTTTLYSLLKHDATPAKNYVTIEDPVEYQVEMAGQVLIREKIGLTFPIALRSILRQDPDVILVGEIRDLETAEVAFHAALTGHLVYSTLHTNSATASIVRLLDLGLKPHVVATGLEGIIAQRLVRRLCAECREETALDQEKLRWLGSLSAVSRSYRGRGCAACNQTGYRGRVGLFEVLVPDDRMRSLISQGASTIEFTRLARDLGATSLIEDGLTKVNAGFTSLEEVFRVLGPQ